MDDVALPCGSSDDSTPSSDDLYSLLSSTLEEQRRIFPSIDLQSVFRLGHTMNLRKLQRHSQIKRLLGVFSDAGLDPKVGFNPGTGDISLTVCTGDGPVRFLESRYVAKASLEPHGEDGNHVGSLAQHLVLWVGLGILWPHQDALETLHRNRRDGLADPTALERDALLDDGSEVVARARKEKFHPGFSESSKKRLAQGSSPRGVAPAWRAATSTLLANECLKVLLLQTGVAIVDMKHNVRLKKVFLKLDSAAKGILSLKEGRYYTDKHYEPYRWAPAYTHLLGYDPSSDACTLDLQLSQMEALLKSIVDQWWRLVESKCYYPDPALRIETTKVVEQFFRHCLKRHGRGTAMQQFSLYLHGRAGIGKSRFVQVFTSCLRTLVHRYLDPERRVQVVRVPLNALTPSNFRQILLVHGISDYSVERILEQTVCRGGVVVLHLEENPRDAVMQQRLHELTVQLLSSITSRYPEYRFNVLYIYTSNYPPVESISGKCTSVLEIQPPNRSMQLQWAAKALQSSITSFVDVKGSRIEVDLRAEPPLTTDMRKLEIWRMSLAFLAGERLLRYAGKPLVRGRRIVVRMCDGKSMLDGNGGGDGRGPCDAPSEPSEPSERGKEKGSSLRAMPEEAKGIVLSFFAPKRVRRSKSKALDRGASPSLEGDSIERASPASPGSLAPLPAHTRVHAISHDGFFHYASETEQRIVEGSMVKSSPLLDDAMRMLDYLHQPCLLTMMDMLRSNYLKPAVIVLMGSDGGGMERYQMALRSLADDAARGAGGELHYTRVTAVDESDKEAVIGDPKSPGLGGLYRFIDNVTNPVFQRPKDLVMVEAHVNEVGQFMMRELLEAGVSRTHRNRVRKHRTLFVMSLFPGVAISPQLESRAHMVLNPE